MNVQIFRRVGLLAGLIIAFVITTKLALAVTGTWYQSSYTMTGSLVTASWPPPLDKETKADSQAAGPAPMQQISVLVQMRDRCKAANGTWYAWKQYKVNNTTKSQAYTTGYMTTRGTYQNCQFGHEYRDESTHTFYQQNFGINRTWTLVK